MRFRFPLPSSIYKMYPYIDIWVLALYDHLTVIEVLDERELSLVGVLGILAGLAAANLTLSLKSESPMIL